MNIRIYHAVILTMKEGEPLTYGELWIQDGILTCVGKVPEERSTPVWDRQIDAGHNLVMPGFKNAHNPIRP